MQICLLTWVACTLARPLQLSVCAAAVCGARRGTPSSSVILAPLRAVYATVMTYSGAVEATCWVNNPCQFNANLLPLACRDQSGAGQPTSHASLRASLPVRQCVSDQSSHMCACWLLADSTSHLALTRRCSGAVGLVQVPGGHGPRLFVSKLLTPLLSRFAVCPCYTASHCNRPELYRLPALRTCKLKCSMRLCPLAANAGPIG